MFHAVLSGPGGGPFKDLGTLSGYSDSIGYAVNASGQVAGYASNESGGSPTRAFLSGPGGGALQDLGTLGGSYSNAYGVNDSGQVVGVASTAGNVAYHAFLYSGGQMLDLTTLLAPTGFTLGDLNGISDNGYIIGAASAPDGSTVAILLTPVPEPCGLLLLGTGAVALLGYAARRRAGPSA